MVDKDIESRVLVTDIIRKNAKSVLSGFYRNENDRQVALDFAHDDKSTQIALDSGTSPNEIAEVQEYLTNWAKKRLAYSLDGGHEITIEAEVLKPERSELARPGRVTYLPQNSRVASGRFKGPNGKSMPFDYVAFGDGVLLSFDNIVPAAEAFGLEEYMSRRKPA